MEFSLVTIPPPIASNSLSRISINRPGLTRLSTGSGIIAFLDLSLRFLLAVIAVVRLVI